jgi:predicted transporter
MALWIYGFAALNRPLPAVAVFLALLAAAAVQVVAGYAIGRWGALALGAAPVVIALAAAGVHSTLWTTVVVLTVFPGVPLIGLGVYLRRRWEERNDRRPDAWLYGEESL